MHVRWLSNRRQFFLQLYHGWMRIALPDEISCCSIISHKTPFRWTSAQIKSAWDDSKATLAESVFFILKMEKSSFRTEDSKFAFSLLIQCEVWAINSHRLIRSFYRWNESLMERISCKLYRYPAVRGARFERPIISHNIMRSDRRTQNQNKMFKLSL